MDTASPIALGVIVLASGLLLLGWGYKLVRLVLGVAGLLIGGALGWELGQSVGLVGGFLYGAAAIGAVLLAVLMPLLRKLGIFLLGFGAGSALGTLLMGSPTTWAEGAVIVGAGIGGGLIGLFLERFLLVTATSFLGALGAVTGFGSITGLGLTVEQFLAQDPGATHTIPLVALVVIAALWVGGFAWQMGRSRKRRKQE